MGGVGVGIGNDSQDERGQSEEYFHKSPFDYTDGTAERPAV
jgi:hypothetical protein